MDPQIDASDLQLHIFAGAAFADDIKSSKSTSGAFLVMRSKLEKSGRQLTNFPSTGSSTSQSCQAHPTPEAGVVSLDAALTKAQVHYHMWPHIIQYDEASNLKQRKEMKF